MINVNIILLLGLRKIGLPKIIQIIHLTIFSNYSMPSTMVHIKCIVVKNGPELRFLWILKSSQEMKISQKIIYATNH